MDARQIRPANQRPALPQHASSGTSSSSSSLSTSSTSSSAFQSPSSVASLAAHNTRAMPRSTTMHLAGSGAPLPSPSTQQPAAYFAPLNSQVPPTQQAHAQQQAAFVGQRRSGGAPETASFLQDFSLLAEAAKRAEMACLSRDLDEIGL